MSDATENKKSEEETFQEEQAAAARAQNLPEGHVPEQRPQASTTNEGAGDSDLTKQLRKHGALPEEQEPMGKEAYDRASSKAQMKKAADDSKVEGPMVGSRVRATKGPHEGRIFAVTRIVSDSNVADIVRRFSGSPEQLYNQPKEIEVTAIGDERDGERLILDVEENGLEKLNESFAGTRAGRRH